MNEHIRKTVEEYWLKKLSGSPPALELPWLNAGIEGEAVERYGFTRDLLPGISDQLRKICKNSDIALLIIFATGLNVLLYRYTGSGDLPVGTEVAGQVVICRSWVNGRDTVKAVLDEVKKQFLEAFNHGDYSFTDMLQKLASRQGDPRPIPFGPALVYRPMQENSTLFPILISW